MTAKSDAGIAALQKELAEMLDPIDYPGDWSIRQVNAEDERRRMIQGQIHDAFFFASTLAEVDPLLATNTPWQEYLVAWRKILSDELLELAPRTAHDFGVQQNLSLSIQMIHQGEGVVRSTGYGLETLRLGALMREAGYQAAPAMEGQTFGRLPWFGSLPEVSERIAKLTKRRAEAQSQLDEALLDPAARAQLTAQRIERAARLNAMSKTERAAAIAAEQTALT